MSFISREQTLRDIDVDFLAFADGFNALVIRGRDILILVDLRSPKQQMMKSGHDMKPSGCLHRPNSQVEVDVANGEGCIASKPDTLIG